MTPFSQDPGSDMGWRPGRSLEASLCFQVLYPGPSRSYPLTGTGEHLQPESRSSHSGSARCSNSPEDATSGSRRSGSEKSANTNLAQSALLRPATEQLAALQPANQQAQTNLTHLVARIAHTGSPWRASRRSGAIPSTHKSPTPALPSAPRADPSRARDLRPQPKRFSTTSHLLIKQGCRHG